MHSILKLMMTNELNILSEELLLLVKTEKETSLTQEKLGKISLNTFHKELNTDEKKKAFWINIYNAYFLILRKEKNITKPDIYNKKLFKIAYQPLSLDDIEHGILRRNKYKYSLGFLSKFFPPKFIKENMVEKLDYRIHFALNCGAKSCPPIAFYKPENLNQQLDLATQSFLESETVFDTKNKKVMITALFKWYFADFKGIKGIKNIFKKQLNKDISDHKISYNKYSWDENLENFV